MEIQLLSLNIFNLSNYPSYKDLKFHSWNTPRYEQEVVGGLNFANRYPPGKSNHF